MEPALSLDSVTVWRPLAGTATRLTILDTVTWQAQPGERWAVLGQNGAGKSTLLNLLGAVTHPSSGTVAVLGNRLGKVALPTLRRQIGFVDPGLERSFAPSLLAEQVVLTGRTNTILFFQEMGAPRDRLRARALLSQLGCEPLAERPFGRCSSGERKRILIARALMCEPGLLVLDEPSAGLDLGGRELLLRSLDTLVDSHPELTTVLVTHHPEELPRSTTHVLLLRAGRIVTAGRIAEALTEETMAACFDIDVSVRYVDGRWTVAARGR